MFRPIKWLQHKLYHKNEFFFRPRSLYIVSTPTFFIFGFIFQHRLRSKTMFIPRNCAVLGGGELRCVGGGEIDGSYFNVFIVIFFTQLEKRWEKRNKVCKVSACEGRRRVFSACERKRRVFSACERKRRVFSACERKRRVFSACERKRLFSSSFPARVGKCWIFQIITLSSFSTRGVQT